MKILKTPITAFTTIPIFLTSKKFLILPMFAVLLLVLLSSIHEVIATSNTISDYNSCITVKGAWDSGSNTCSLYNYRVESGNSLTINKGVTLNIYQTSSDYGSIINYGTILISDGSFLIIYGDHGATFNNFGTIENHGGIHGWSATLNNCGDPISTSWRDNINITNNCTPSMSVNGQNDISSGSSSQSPSVNAPINPTPQTTIPNSSDSAPSDFGPIVDLYDGRDNSRTEPGGIATQYASGDDISFEVWAAEGNKLVKSIDGGKTFTITDHPDTPLFGSTCDGNNCSMQTFSAGSGNTFSLDSKGQLINTFGSEDKTYAFTVKTEGYLLFEKSNDGGKTFGNQILLNPDGTTDTPAQVGKIGNNLYMATKLEKGIDFAKSTDDGNTFTLSKLADGKILRQIMMAGSQNNIYIFGDEYVPSKYPPSPNFWILTSNDGGKTFTTGANVDNPGSHAERPQLFASGNYVYLFWNDNQVSPGFYKISFIVSSDGGKTFSSPRSFTDDVMDVNYPPSIIADANNVYVFGQNTQNLVNGTMLFTESNDGGNIFSKPVTVGYSGIGGGGRMIMSGNHLYLTWTDADVISPTYKILFRQFVHDSNISPSGSVTSIPSWVKNNAKWWSQGQVGDSDFIQGIQYLIQQGIMQIPQTQASSGSSQQIPTWVKTNAGWWADGQISDDEFVKGIQYLISNGILRTS